MRHFAKVKIQIQMLLHHLQDDYFTTKSFDELMPYPRASLIEAYIEAMPYIEAIWLAAIPPDFNFGLGQRHVLLQGDHLTTQSFDELLPYPRSL